MSKIAFDWVKRLIEWSRMEGLYDEKKQKEEPEWWMKRKEDFKCWVKYKEEVGWQVKYKEEFE